MIMWRPRRNNGGKKRKPRKCRLTRLQGRPRHAFVQDTNKYHQSARLVRPSAHLIFGCVLIVFATTSLRPIAASMPILVNNVFWQSKKCRHTRLQGRPLHAFVEDTNEYHQSAGVVHPSASLIFSCVIIVFATTSLRPMPTPLLNLGNNVWWKPKKCRLTLLQGSPLHAFAQDPNKFHHSAGVVHPSAPLLICCVKIFFSTLFFRPTTTPLLNLGNNVCGKPKKCRYTLLQGRPLHALAQDPNKFHHSAGVTAVVHLKTAVLHLKTHVYFLDNMSFLYSSSLFVCFSGLVGL